MTRFDGQPLGVAGAAIEALEAALPGKITTAQAQGLVDALSATLTPQIAAKYAKPSGGIPGTDLTSAVQAALALAGTALQSIGDGTVSLAKLTSAVQASLAKADSALQTIADGSLSIAKTSGLQGALDAKLATTDAAATYGAVRTTVKTAAYTAAPGDLVPVDTTNGPITVTLPSAPANGARVTVKHILQGDANAVAITTSGTDVLNRSGGTTSLTLPFVNQSAVFVYSSSTGIWTVISTDLPKSALDAIYTSKAELAATVYTVNAATGETPSATLTRINAALAAGSAFGIRKTVILVGDFTVNGPLVQQSNTILDTRAATITLATGSNSNLWVNRSAVTVQRTVTDVATTSGSTTVTSASAAFTAADVGRNLYLAGASANGYVLCGLITAVTNSTTAVLDTAAGQTLTGVTGTFYDRDTNITVIGGQWNRGNNGGNGLDRMTIRPRRIDRATFRDMRLSSLDGKYIFHGADLTALRVIDTDLDCFSDGIHLSGPIRGAFIRNVTGTSGDDCVALGNSDVTFQDTFGDLDDVLVDGVQAKPRNGTTQVKVYGVAATGGLEGAPGAAAGARFRNLRIGNLQHATSTSSAIAVQADAVIDSLSIDGVTSVGTAASLVSLNSAALEVVTLANLHANGPAATTNHGLVQVQASAVIGRLILQRSAQTAAGPAPRTLWVKAGASIGSVKIDALAVKASTALCLAYVEGTISKLVLGQTTIEALGGQVLRVRSGGTVSLLQATANAYVSSGLQGAFLMVEGFLPLAFLYGNSAEGAQWTIGDFASTTDLHLYGHSGNGGAVINLQATAVLNIFGAGPLRYDGTPPTTAAGYALRVNHRGFRLDASKITNRSLGDVAYNTNSTSGAPGQPEVGEVVWDGTVYRMANLPYVKTGSATLAAGTVAVADTKITAGSRVRVFNVNPAGTPGYVYVTLNPSTGFTITSTSGADTSSINYEIVRY